MDFKNFKKIGVTRMHTIFEHPEGHIIHVSNKNLPKNLKEEMRDIPVQKLAKGGRVEEAEGLYPKENPLSSLADFLTAPIGGHQQVDPEALRKYGSMDQATAARRVEEADVLPPGVHVSQETVIPGQQEPQNFQLPQMQQQPQQNLMQQGADKSLGLYNQAIGEQKSGLQHEAQAVASRAQQEQQTLEKGLDSMNQFQAHYQKQLSDLNSERQALLDDVQNGHIDPNRLISNMSTGKRITTAIGLILGGIGAGARGGENPVHKFLQEQINQDINAQKAELGKKENLLSSNLRHYGNLKDAMEATRLNQMDLLKANLQMAAAKSSTPLAKAEAEKAIGKLDMESAPIMAQLSMRRAAMGGGAGDMNPSLAVRFLVDPKDQKEAFKELQHSQTIEAMRSDYDKAFSDIKGKFMNGVLSPKDVYSAKQAFIGKLIKETEGRYNYEAAQNLAEALYPGKLDADSTTNNKLQRGHALFDSLVSTPTLSAYGINLPKSMSAKPNLNVMPKKK